MFTYHCGNMEDKELHPAEHLVPVEFGFSMSEAEKELKPTPAQRVLTYVTILHYTGEKSYRKKIREELGVGSNASEILAGLEEAGWIKRKYEMVDGVRVKACHPTYRGERILGKCGLPPFD